MTWHGTTRHDTTQNGMAWHTTRHDTIRHSIVWRNVLRTYASGTIFQSTLEVPVALVAYKRLPIRKSGTRLRRLSRAAPCAFTDSGMGNNKNNAKCVNIVHAEPTAEQPIVTPQGYAVNTVERERLALG